jgi:hypothetical protein
MCLVTMQTIAPRRRRVSGRCRLVGISFLSRDKSIPQFLDLSGLTLDRRSQLLDFRAEALQLLFHVARTATAEDQYDERDQDQRSAAQADLLALHQSDLWGLVGRLDIRIIGSGHRCHSLGHSRRKQVG